MATTRLMPLHIGKGRTMAEALGRTTDYVKNPEKTEAAILEHISGKRIVVPKQKQAALNLLIDIQAKLKQAHSPGFERWVCVFNLKEMAKTLNYLQEHNLTAYADLKSTCDAAAQKYHDLSDCTKANSARKNGDPPFSKGGADAGGGLKGAALMRRSSSLSKNNSIKRIQRKN